MIQLATANRLLSKSMNLKLNFATRVRTGRCIIASLAFVCIAMTHLSLMKFYYYFCIGFDHDLFTSITVEIIKNTSVMNYFINSTSTMNGTSDSTVSVYSSIVNSITSTTSSMNVLSNMITSSMPSILQIIHANY